MRRIYETAYKVVAWLGAAADYSDLAMDFMDQSKATFLKPRGPIIFPFESTADLVNNEVYMALVKLFSRPYWQRVWTMQETAIAKSLHVLCGTKSIQWTDLVELIG